MVTIKNEPEHFFVREISKPVFSEDGEYAYVLLRKRNYTTERAIYAISRALRVSCKRIGVAGNKDKFALTEQVISIWKARKEDIERVKLKDIELEFLGYGSERICLGDLQGNEFKITIFCDEKELFDIRKLKEKAEFLSKTGIPNYFGAQRFGIAGNNYVVGRYFLKGDFENAVRNILVKIVENPEITAASKFIDKNWGNWKECIEKIPKFMSMEKAILNHLIKCPNDFAGAFRVLQKNLRRIFIHSYQSWVWNSALSKQFSKSNFSIDIAGEKLKIPDKNFKAEDLPLIGFSSEDDGSKFFKNSVELIEKDGLSIESFRLPRMPELASEGNFRNAKLILSNSSIEKKSNKEFTAKFELGKGSYATVVIEALFA